jgi:hypothetical protein
MSFDPNLANYIETLIHDVDHKSVVFHYMDFSYSAKTFEDIIQYIKGQRASELKTNGEVPTTEELELHDERKEEYNGNHQPIQDWIDSL